MYNTYEDYMRSVLGYNIPNNTYRELDNYYSDNVIASQSFQEVNSLYPEIYGIVYPVVQKVCSRRSGYAISKEQLDMMVEEVYKVVGYEEQEEINRNGDVKNPRAKDVRRPNNYMLKDLIKILLIRELLSGKPNFRPGPIHDMGGMPPRPGNGQMPPIIRTRKSKIVLRKTYYEMLRKKIREDKFLHVFLN